MEVVINYIDEKKLSEDSTIEFGFSLTSDQIETLIFKVYDPLFGIQFIPGEHTIKAHPGINYWIRFEVDTISKLEKPNTRFGFLLTCENTSGEIIFKKEFTRFNKAYELIPRKEGKVAWIIGDSNAWASFGHDQHRYNEIGGFSPVRIGMTSLSLNRFLNGKYLELIKCLPIREEDCLVFYLGEIDFRYTIHKYVKDKNKDLKESCMNLMERYLESLKKISSLVDNRIVIMSPNPIIPDGYHKNKNLVIGNETERLDCFNLFDKFWTEQNDFEYLNWTKEYTGPDGLARVEYFIDGDHHIKDHTKISNSLSKLLLNQNIKKIKLQMNNHDNKIDPKELVDYCLEYELMNKCIFMQVYEEILTFSYWLSGFKPNNVLEIGTMGTTFWLINKLSTGKKVSIDIEPRQSIIHHFMHGEDWKFFQGDSHSDEMFNKVKDFCPQFDFIFIDGDHTYDGVKKDFELYKNLLSPRGVIAFHDIDPDHIFADSYAGQVYKFWQDLQEGTKTNIVCKKSSGKIKLNGQHSQGFGGIGIWRP